MFDSPLRRTIWKTALVGSLALYGCDAKDKAPEPSAKDVAPSKQEVVAPPTKTVAEVAKPVAEAEEQGATGKGRTLNSEHLKVACATCIFKMKDAQGCVWAAEVDGEHVLMEGELPDGEAHDAHADDGMCEVAREAVVSGKLQGGKLVVSQMEIQPLAKKEAPHDHGEGDKHSH